MGAVVLTSRSSEEPSRAADPAATEPSAPAVSATPKVDIAGALRGDLLKAATSADDAESAAVLVALADADKAALRDADWPEIERFLRDLDGTDLMVLAACLQDGKATIMPRLVEILYSQEEPPAAVKEHVERLRAQIAALQTADPAQVT